MLFAFLPINLDEPLLLLWSLLLTSVGAFFLYVVLFHVLRSIFRKFERDIALVTLNVSAYPALIVFILVCLKVAFFRLTSGEVIVWLDRSFTACIIVAASYWAVQLFSQVVAYYLREYAEGTEAMWDQVLIPLLEGIFPMLAILIGGSLILQLSFDVDLTGIWFTVGGATFVIGFAVKDILANFFSGLALLIDTPFQFGDVLRLENGAIAVLRQIGIRVTQLYVLETHTQIYIPNSVLQNQQIINLSRPIAPVYHSTPFELMPECDLELALKTMQEIVQAHPDILGDIEIKLACFDRYYNWKDLQPGFVEKKDNDRQRLLAENQVNLKLEEIEQALEALMVTLQFAEKGGLSREDIETVQQEYHLILDLIGIEVVQQRQKLRRSPFQLQRSRTILGFEEARSADGLISRVREWYRIWLRDPNLVNEDRYWLPDVWERKLELLKRRVQRLYLKILKPQREETRLDDYVKDLIRWLRERFKQARSQWQEPDIRMEKIIHDEGFTYVRFTLGYYVDDIRLEDCKRGKRVTSDIYREIMRHLKPHCISTYRR